MARDAGGQQPMTSERLAAIKTRMEAIPGSIFVTTQKELSQTFFDRNELVEAMEVMLAREAALLAVVRAVANQDYAQDIDDPEWMQCLACGGGGPTGETIEHHETCYYVKARALLASADERSGSDGQQPEQATCPVCGTPGRRVTSRWWCDGCNLPFRRPGEAAGQE